MTLVSNLSLAGGIYSGDINYNQERDGFGTMLYNNDNKYDGHWKNDKRHGLGTLHYSDGDVYEGNWADDTMNGFGIYKLSDGDE